MIMRWLYWQITSTHSLSSGTSQLSSPKSSPTQNSCYPQRPQLTASSGYKRRISRRRSTISRDFTLISTALLSTPTTENTASLSCKYSWTTTSTTRRTASKWRGFQSPSRRITRRRIWNSSRNWMLQIWKKTQRLTFTKTLDPSSQSGSRSTSTRDPSPLPAVRKS